MERVFKFPEMETRTGETGPAPLGGAPKMGPRNGEQRSNGEQWHLNIEVVVQLAGVMGEASWDAPGPTALEPQGGLSLCFAPSIGIRASCPIS